MRALVMGMEGKMDGKGFGERGGGGECRGGTGTVAEVG